MKKIITLLLMVVLCLSLIACDRNKDDAEIVLGNWVGDYNSLNNATIMDSDGKEIFPGDSMTETLSIFKGGTAEILIHDNDTGAEQRYTANWKVSDGILIINRTLNGSDIIDSYEIHTNTEPYTLSVQGTGVPSLLTKSAELSN